MTFASRPGAAVARHHLRPADADFAGLAQRQRSSVVVEDRDLGARSGSPIVPCTRGQDRLQVAAGEVSVRP